MHIIKAFKQISFKDISGLEVFKCIQLDLQLWWLYFAIKIWIIWNIYPGTDSNVFSFFVTNQSLNIVSRENRKIYIAFVLTFHMKLRKVLSLTKFLLKYVTTKWSFYIWEKAVSYNDLFISFGIVNISNLSFFCEIAHLSYHPKGKNLRNCMAVPISDKNTLFFVIFLCTFLCYNCIKIYPISHLHVIKRRFNSHFHIIQSSNS